MRLTLSTLPQLAVLAKILCLLMVVMCGAVPSTVPSVSLYSSCSKGFVTVYGRTVKTTVRNEDNAPYQKMTTQSDNFGKKLYIFAEKSKRYICFSKRWKLISLPKKRRDERCQFFENYNARFLRYQSVVDPNRFIGFNKNGKPVTSLRGRQECYNFIKLNSKDIVERHNTIMASNNGGKPLDRKLSHEISSSEYSRKSQPTENSLVRESRLKQLPQLTTHRHRHQAGNSWKKQQMRKDSTRRRHDNNSNSSSSSRSSLLVEIGSKY